MKPDPNNPKKMLEPFEELIIDTPMDYMPLIIDKINGRKGVLLQSDDLPE